MRNIGLKKIHDHISDLVDCMLELNEKLQGVKGSEQENLKQQISQADHEIDKLVYKLYDLNTEEIQIVEGN